MISEDKEMEAHMEKDLPELKMPKNLMGKIASVFIDRFKVVYLIILTVLLLGIMTYSQLPKETVPDISLSYIYVQVPYPGAAVTDIDSMISEPIEDKLSSLSNVESVTATINNGYALIIAEFEDDADMDEAEQKVRNEVAQVSLPSGAMTPVIGVFETGEMPIFNVTVTGDYDLVALKEYGERIQDQMESVPGIREVSLSGGYDREIRVTVDEVTLREYGLTFAAVTQALQASNINLPAGSLGIDGDDVNVRVDERFTSVEDIENLVIASSADRTLFLHDVAIVTDSYKTPTSLSRLYLYEDADEKTAPAVYLSVYRESGYDIVKPSESLRAIIQSAPAHSIPDDVTLLITSDQSEDVVKDLNTVINNALGGLISVILVLYIFIGLNEALIVSSVIPISLFIALLLMKIMNISFNTISLTGFIIALGLLVDNAIVVMENIDRLREEGVERITAAKMGLNQVAPAVLAATLTTVGAFIPVAMTPGIIGKFLSVMPKTIIFIIAASFFVSIVITPALCSKFLSAYKVKRPVPTRGQMIRSGIFIFALSLLAFSNQWQLTWITVVIAAAFTMFYVGMTISKKRTAETGQHGMIERYKGFIYNLIISKPKKLLVLIIAIIVFAGSVATIPAGLLKLELFPYEEPSSMKINIVAPIGTMLSDTSAITQEVESLLFDIPGLKSFTSNVGGDNANEAMITVELMDENDRTITGEAIQNEIRERVKEVPGAKIEVKAQSAMSRVSSGAAISLGLKGDNLETLQAYAAQYYNVLKDIDGVVEPTLSTDGGNRELVIDIDPNRVAYYGLNLSSVASEIRQHVSGSTVGTYTEDLEEYDITLYYAEGEIQSAKDFDKLFFTATSGEKVNFNEVASLTFQDGIGTIEKEDGDKIIYVEADIASGYNSAEVNREFSEKVADIQLPKGISQQVGGEMRDLNEQIGNMAFNFVIALLMVYIVLVIQFNSFLQPLMILFSVPFAIIGVVIGLIATGNNLGFYAMFGIVALVGIAVNDAIVLIDFTNYLRAEGMPLRSAVAEAVKTRFQPVMATSLTTIGGVLPLALFNDSFSQLGYALIFGLMASTVLTLLIIPILYYSFENISESKKETII
jgi:HAE1 family hydrophobic/amphiphilic exporter-1